MARTPIQDKIILGIDPGTTISGFGVIECKGEKLTLLSMGVIDLRKDLNQALKLQKIYAQCELLIKKFLPDEFAIEAPFYGKNPQSMLKLGRAQGVAIAAALNRGIPIFEYAPKRVKQSVTGNGNASKEQVAGMVKTLLNLKETDSRHDASDAVAIAICHHFMFRPGLAEPTESYSGWKSFVGRNPEKLI